MKEIKKLPSYFLMALVLASLYFAYQLFRPYIAVIIMGAIFAMLFYRPYKWLAEKLRGRESAAALLTVLLFILIIVIPVGNFIALLVKETLDSLPKLEQRISNGDVSLAFNQTVEQLKVWQEHYLPFFDFSTIDFRRFIVDLGKRFSNFIVANASDILSGTTNFIVSLFFMLLTMYYLLKDGERFMVRLMKLTPLPSKYDVKLFEMFRDMGRSTVIGSLVTAIAQGALAAIAYTIAGLPPFFLGVATGVASLIPVVGTGLVWLPVAVVLAVAGKWFAAIFLIAYGVLVIGLSDNVIRTYVIGSKSKIHPLLIFFSIFGGIALWGALGLIFGPLMLSLILTVLRIYELEYDNLLDK